jgi:RHS repeat-associated protein
LSSLGDGTGTVQTQYTYEPFGYATSAGQANSNSYKYTGREDDGSGLYYYRARYYSPRLQRFIAEDSIEFSGGINFYAYVSNNPMNGLDPLGLFNPSKGISALGNSGIAGWSAASGALKIMIAAGLSPAASTGVGALPPTAPYAWGAWNIKSAKAAWVRSYTQWNQALCEDWSQATWKNLYGLLPGGIHYDDPNEPNGPWNYIKTQGWWNFFTDLGYF